MYFTGFMRKKAEMYGDKIDVLTVADMTGNWNNAHSKLSSPKGIERYRGLNLNLCLKFLGTELKSKPEKSKRGGLNRCLHLGDAKLEMNITKNELYSKIADWYINGDWTVKMKDFNYGKSKIGNKPITQGHMLDLA